jgi:O-antigen/teichoic acid export membrane protein
MDEQQSLPRRMVSASKWSLLSEASSRAITPLTFLILARLLDPDSFGIFALAALIITFAQILWDSGLSKALIQRKGDPNDVANVIFFANLALGLFLYLLIHLLAQKLAELLGDLRLETVLRVQGLQMFTGSAASVQNALLQRRMDFKALFRARMMTILVGSAVALSLAGLGYGYWALVGGVLIGDAGRAIYLWFLSPWRPQWRFDLPLARELWTFGGWVLLEELLAWFIVWGDSAFVGLYLGAHDLGIYRTGSLIVAMILSTLLEPLVPVTFSGLSRVQDERERFNAYVDRVTRLFAVIALPIGASILALRQPIVDIVLGEQWDGIQPVIGAFAVATGLSYALSAFPPAFRAAGRTRAFATLRVLSFCYILPAYLFSIQVGLLVFLYARIGVTVLTMILYAFTVNHCFRYGFVAFFRSFASGLFWAFSLWGTTVVLTYLFGQGLLAWHQVIVVSLLLTGMGLHLLFLSKDRSFFRQIVHLSIGKA